MFGLYILKLYVTEASCKKYEKTDFHNGGDREFTTMATDKNQLLRPNFKPKLYYICTIEKLKRMTQYKKHISNIVTTDYTRKTYTRSGRKCSSKITFFTKFPMLYAGTANTQG